MVKSDPELFSYPFIQLTIFQSSLSLTNIVRFIIFLGGDLEVYPGQEEDVREAARGVRAPEGLGARRVQGSNLTFI